jgi:serine/threonine protein kinase
MRPSPSDIQLDHDGHLLHFLTIEDLSREMDGGMETQTGTFMGTLPYMSPEYVLDKPLDGRSDIYSLGVVLYQLATGKLPFTITTPTEAVMKHLNDIPTAPYEHQPGLPTGVSTLILKSLAKEPENRYQTAEEFAHSLRETNLRLTDDQSTDFATDSDVISVVTSLHERRQVLAKIETVSYEPPGDYRLVITEGDHTPHSHKLNQFTLVLGRAHDCDVVLNGDNVSRYHARLEWNGRSWQLTDLGSTNGTYLDNNPLIPEKPVNWSPTQTVKLGVFYLQLQTADAPAPPIYQSPIYQSPTPPANRFFGEAVVVPDGHAQFDHYWQAFRWESEQIEQGRSPDESPGAVVVVEANRMVYTEHWLRKSGFAPRQFWSASDDGRMNP